MPLHLYPIGSTHVNSSSDPKENIPHHQRKMKMREMRTEDFMKVEESLQNHFSSIESQDWKSNLNSLNSTNDSPYGSLTKQHRSNSEDEFFSMSEFPLPQLGQPTLLNTVKQCNLTGGQAINTTATTTATSEDHFSVDLFSPNSPRSTLSNVSLGGSSGSLNSKGTFSFLPLISSRLARVPVRLIFRVIVIISFFINSFSLASN